MSHKPHHHGQAAQQYLKTRVLTATAEQLQMMLWDGVVRFTEQGKIALECQELRAGLYQPVKGAEDRLPS